MPLPHYISCPKVPKFQNLNQAVIVGQEVHLAGCIGMTADQIMKSGVKEQARQALKNMQTLLEFAGSDMDHVYSLNVFLDISLSAEEVEQFNEIYREVFKNEQTRPIRCCVQVKNDGILVEIANARALLK